MSIPTGVAVQYLHHAGPQFSVEINKGIGFWWLAVLLWGMPASNSIVHKHLEPQTLL